MMFLFILFIYLLFVAGVCPTTAKIKCLKYIFECVRLPLSFSIYNFYPMDFQSRENGSSFWTYSQIPYWYAGVPPAF